MANTYRHWLDLPQEQLLDIIRRLSITELINVCSTSSDLEQRICLEENFLRELAKRYLTNRTLGKDELKYIIIDIDHLQKVDESKRLIFAAERNYEKVVFEIVDTDTTETFSYSSSADQPEPMFIEENKVISDVVPRYPVLSLEEFPNTSFINYYSYIGVAMVIAAAYNYEPMFTKLLSKVLQTKQEYGDYDYSAVFTSERAASYNGSIAILDAMKFFYQRNDLDYDIDSALIASNKASLEWLIVNKQAKVDDDEVLRYVNQTAAKYFNSVALYEWFYRQFPYTDSSIYFYVAQNKTGAGVAIAKYLAETVKLGDVVPVDARAATIAYLADKGLLHYTMFKKETP